MTESTTETTSTIAANTAPSDLVDHNLTPERPESGIRYELKPATRPDGSVAEGLYNAWIYLNNPNQYNSYTTEMVKELILAFRRASNARDVNAVVFTAVGDKAFCTGGNTKEYAEYYAGNPQEYRQYMRLFNDMVTSILTCDKPVICRVNGMRIGGGQEIGMACDFTVTQDLALFGQAGPKHGSAAIGGATDFLPVMIGCEQAMVSGTLCEPFSAHKRGPRKPVAGLSGPRDWAADAGESVPLTPTSTKIGSVGKAGWKLASTRTQFSNARTPAPQLQPRSCPYAASR